MARKQGPSEQAPESQGGQQSPSGREPMHRVLVFPDPRKASLGEVVRSLESCGATVHGSYRLVGGLCVKVTPKILAEAVRRHPWLTILPDRRRRLPPVPFSRAEREGLPATGRPGSISVLPLGPRVAPLALDLMEVPAANKLGVNGSGVRVAIIDSGESR